MKTLSLAIMAATSLLADVPAVHTVPASADEALRDSALAALRKAAGFYRERVASHGGYVYFYSTDLKKRWGEGEATSDQIWVQPPGTPTVGLAYLQAYRATNDPYFRDAAQEAAEALVYGQITTGGWTNCIDFDPRGKRVAQYRNGRGKGRNTSSLDDGQTQSAIRLLMAVDAALDFEHREIHEAAMIALGALLEAQFANGGFPQVWDDKLADDQPIVRADYPDHDWRTEGRIKEYWDMYTLNDGVPGYVAQVLLDAHRVYGEDRYLESLARLGGFLVLSQMPDPQPAWAQQYNYRMHPIWARKFEPPAIASDESQETLETLLAIYRTTGDEKYLEPISPALAWLKNSLLPDGRLARYYELETNRPLYMQRRGGTYTLTYDDSNLPGHYGWKIESRLSQIEEQYRKSVDGKAAEIPVLSRDEGERPVRQVISELDSQGRWISRYRGERLVGQPKFTPGMQYISSQVFADNLAVLSEYVAALSAMPGG